MHDTMRMPRLLITFTFAWSAMATASESSCEPQGDMQFLCGPQNAEDLVSIGDTRWIVASGMTAAGSPGRLYLIDSERKSYEVLFPGEQPAFRHDEALFGDCPGPLDTSNFSSHGLAIRARGGGIHRLYMTSHGAREAVEIFELDARGEKPGIAWVGCVPMPASSFTNSVTILADGGFLATKMIDAQVPSAFADAIAGKVTGYVYEWRPATGLRRLPNTDYSGPNGIEVTADGKYMFLAAWGNRRLLRYRLDGSGDAKEPTQDGSVELEFSPDNLRWAPDGKLLVTGHRLVPPEQCSGGLCTDGWSVVALDPVTLNMTTLIDKGGDAPFQDATVALRVGDELWIGTWRGDRIVYMRAPDVDR